LSTEIERTSTLVVGLGAGGHARVVIDILRLTNAHNIVGLLDADQNLWKTEVAGVPVLGGDDLLPGLYAQGTRHAFIGVGTTGDPRPRQFLYQKVLDCDFQIVSAVHPQSIISADTQIGRGATIMAGAVINPGARLGDNVIVNTKASVDHDCVIGNHVHISVGVTFGGGVSVGDRTMIGIGAVIMPGLRIGADAVVGAGSVVTKDVPENTVVIGCPAKVVRSNSSREG